jgi:hypothetical protein
MVELLIRLSLGMEPTDDFETALHRLIAPLAQREATVEDAAEATIRLYRFVAQLPNIPLMGDTLEHLRLDPDDLSIQLADGGTPDFGSAQPYHSPDPVGYRDELKPELVEAMARARESNQQAGEASGLSAEQLGQLLEKSGELDLGDLSQGEARNSLGTFVTNILREAGQGAQSGQAQTAGEPGRHATAVRHALGASDPKVFLYDEWTSGRTIIVRHGAASRSRCSKKAASSSSNGRLSATKRW